MFEQVKRQMCLCLDPTVVKREREREREREKESKKREIKALEYSHTCCPTFSSLTLDIFHHCYCLGGF